MLDAENFMLDLEKYESVVNRTESIEYTGKVTKIEEMFIESEGPEVMMGEICKIICSDKNTSQEKNASYLQKRKIICGEKITTRDDELEKNQHIIMGEVVGIDNGKVRIMCYDEIRGVHEGDRVVGLGETLSVYVGEHLLGRIVDGLGKDYDGLGGIGSTHYCSVFREPPDANTRKIINEPLPTGIKAIDGLITIGKGQRIGIFAGSGVGKSTLLGMIARNAKADVNVVALIGERGRELREFIERDLGPEGLKRSVIVYASSDENALNKVRAAYTATTIAEYFRDQGKDVILMMDNLTRFAMAQREIGLSTGEPPSQKGYTPSVFALMPKLLERAGTSDKGSITGIYAVLVDADDMNEPISDAARSILDGHIVLDRKIAQRNHYPAIDVLASVSRVARQVTSKDQRDKAALIRNLMAEYRSKEQLIDIGAYVQGANRTTDLAIGLKDSIDSFLIQDIEDAYSYDDVLAEMNKIFGVEEQSEEESEENQYSIFD